MEERSPIMVLAIAFVLFTSACGTAVPQAAAPPEPAYTSQATDTPGLETSGPDDASDTVPRALPLGTTVPDHPSDTTPPPSPLRTPGPDELSELSPLLPSLRSSAPITPSSPSPPNGAIDRLLNVDLRWASGGPDPDLLTYQVYLEPQNATPNRLICDTPDHRCDLGWLDPDTHYYWRVVVSDDDGAAATGPVWDFTTGSLEATLKLVPERSTIGVGENLHIDVAIADAADLIAYEFTVTFDPSVVRVQGVEDGGFLGTTGRSLSILGPDIDIETGSVTFGALTVGSEQGPSGPGVLATVSLMAVGVGSSSLDVHEAQTFDAAGNPQVVGVQDGSITVEGATSDSP